VRDGEVKEEEKPEEEQRDGGVKEEGRDEGRVEGREEGRDEGESGMRRRVGRRKVVEEGAEGDEAQPMRREPRRSARKQREGAREGEAEPAGEEACSRAEEKGRGVRKELEEAEEGGFVVAVVRSSSVDGFWDAVSGSIGEKTLVLCLPAPNSAEACAMGRKGKGKAKKRHPPLQPTAQALLLQQTLQGPRKPRMQGPPWGLLALGSPLQKRRRLQGKTRLLGVRARRWRGTWRREWQRAGKGEPGARQKEVAGEAGRGGGGGGG